MTNDYILDYTMTKETIKYSAPQTFSLSIALWAYMVENQLLSVQAKPSKKYAALYSVHLQLF